jgi:hypothetical protein
MGIKSRAGLAVKNGTRVIVHWKLETALYADTVTELVEIRNRRQAPAGLLTMKEFF